MPSAKRNATSIATLPAKPVASVAAPQISDSTVNTSFGPYLSDSQPPMTCMNAYG
ncbi:hypothetical protein SAMN05192563_100274 [Paraburkholderia aspalathi]|uniref:Uncharacterized protein n=1 Tax=Paraburkholderia aspalathi TaxID=1324617 RepID=A0A1I6Z0S7_9BURK|nr:hypothetical protein SAMN05192563_100274 [Paraburkholderia aspalathi]